ncbi:MAG TPA: 2-phospho-L-lactate transferase [Dehalococcoidia bacterium]|nr:2-phospho-L-lactate transferase [Dehalococcoidia bacterium]
MKVLGLAGGVGGAKLMDGLAMLSPRPDLTVVVNTGDDFDHLGLRICPDLDTVMYTLAGLANPETGWGPKDESFQALETLRRLGAPTWFRLGDRDLGLHLERTRRLMQGERLTEVTRSICESLGVGPSVLPMTDDTVATKVQTPEGELDFQDYFVRLACRPVVTGFRFDGIEEATASSEALTALDHAEVVIFGPSNPFVSIAPILGLAGVSERVAARPAVAVSPIVGGQAIKGPAAKMLVELGLEASPVAVAKRYAGVIGGFVLDTQDRASAPDIEALGLRVLVTDTVMHSSRDRARLAQETLNFVRTLTPVSG